MNRKVDDIKKDFLTKLQRQNASILSSSLDEDLVPDLTVLDPEMMSELLFFGQKLRETLFTFPKSFPFHFDEFFHKPHFTVLGIFQS